MRKIYETGAHITQILLVIGIIAVVIGGLVAYGGDNIMGGTLCATGVSLMIASFALSLLVYIGEDIHYIRNLLDAQVEDEDSKD